MPASSKEFLDIHATIECGFTLKRVRNMTKTYSLDGWFGVLFDKLIIFSYLTLNWSIICCLFSRYIYLSFGISVSLSTVSKVFWGDFIIILLAILLPIKSPVACNCYFCSISSASLANYLAWSDVFGYIYCLCFCLSFK